MSYPELKIVPNRRVFVIFEGILAKIPLFALNDVVKELVFISWVPKRISILYMYV